MPLNVRPSTQTLFRKNDVTVNCTGTDHGARVCCKNIVNRACQPLLVCTYSDHGARMKRQALGYKLLKYCMQCTLDWIVIILQALRPVVRLQASRLSGSDQQQDPAEGRLTTLVALALPPGPPRARPTLTPHSQCQYTPTLHHTH